MMRTATTKDLGHRESVTDLPRPTAPVGVRFLGILGLPAVALSWTSVGVTLAVVGVLQATPVLRSLFRLPVPPGVTALAAAALAGIVAYRCRERPGRRLPRFWPLVLTFASLSLALATFVDPVARGAPWRHAACLACLAGASVLLVRLVTVRPDRRWVELVAPGGLSAAVLLVLLPALLAGRWGFAREVEHIEETVRLMHEWAEELASLGRNSLHGKSGPGRSEDRLRAVATFSFEERGGFDELWSAASALGREDELERAASHLLAAVVEGLDPDRAPRISSLDEPAVRWDPEGKEWIVGAEFRRVSGLVGSYYRSLGALFAALDPASLQDGSQALAAYRQRYPEEREALRRHLEATLAHWSDHWAVARVPGVGELVGRVEPPLDRLLETSLVPEAPEGVVPAEVGRLLSLTREDARSLARRAPGCHLRRYREDEIEYERVDCHAFRAASAEGANGAELRLEIRLVFVGSAAESSNRDSDRPVEVFFLFPVPKARSGNEHLGEVAGAVADAARARHRGEFRFLDRGGSALHGFVLEEGSERVVVYRPQLVPFLDEREAVVVRAERAEG